VTLLKDRKAFTLLELMITVAILAILAALSLYAYSHFIKSGQQVNPVHALLAASAAEEQYYSENGQYATKIKYLSGFNDTSTSDDNDFRIFASSGSNEKTYKLWVANADSTSYRIDAENLAGTDHWHIACNATSPIGTCKPVHDSGEHGVVEKALQ
jgi:prepilin-type N-terminal cleavage/methylation domain-containing protein